MMLEVLVSLGRLLAPSDDTLAADLRLSVEQPSAYLEQHPETRERLRMSSDPVADPALPWLALADGLIARDLSAELDWNYGGDDFLWNLKRMKTYSLLSETTKAWLESSVEDEMTLIARLRAFAGRAEADGVFIDVMDIESDSYILLLVPKSDHARARELAEKLGRVMDDIRNHDPNE